MNHFVIILILFFGSLNVNAQVSRARFAALAGYNYNGDNFWETGVVYGERGNEELIGSSLFYNYISLSSEFNFNDKTIICPKLGIHAAWALVHIGISAFNYTDFTYHKPGLRPEIGLTLAGLVSVTYGYSLAPNSDQFNFSNHTLGIKVIFGSRLFGFKN